MCVAKEVFVKMLSIHLNQGNRDPFTLSNLTQYTIILMCIQTVILAIKQSLLLKLFSYQSLQLPNE